MLVELNSVNIQVYIQVYILVCIHIGALRADPALYGGHSLAGEGRHTNPHQINS